MGARGWMGAGLWRGAGPGSGDARGVIGWHGEKGRGSEGVWANRRSGIDGGRGYGGGGARKLGHECCDWLVWGEEEGL